MIPTCPETACWQALLDGTLSEDEQTALTAHLDFCSACQQTLQQLAAGHNSWSGVARDLAAAAPEQPGPLQNVIAQLKAQGTTAEAADSLPGAVAGEANSYDFLAPSD
jgi:anti-sigma factor RsiW